VNSSTETGNTRYGDFQCALARWMSGYTALSPHAPLQMPMPWGQRVFAEPRARGRSSDWPTERCWYQRREQTGVFAPFQGCRHPGSCVATGRQFNVRPQPFSFSWSGTKRKLYLRVGPALHIHNLVSASRNLHWRRWMSPETCISRPAFPRRKILSPGLQAP